MQHRLPDIRGEYKFDFSLKELSFFKVGGNCDIFFVPKDENDLSDFLMNIPKELPIICLGNISNTLILDGGIEGCVINLIGSLNKIEFFEGCVKVGAGVILAKFIKECTKNDVSSCENLFCIPGTIGGAIIMNAGIPNFEISDVLISIDCVDMHGNKCTFKKDELNMSYRNGNIPKDLIITSATFKTSYKPEAELNAVIKEILSKRIKSQPIGKATCGSTFKNPEGLKAWQLIKDSGCGTLNVGDAIVSDVHCNFLINNGNAKASDFRKLIDTIKEKVFDKTGVLLQEEIITIGRK